ncbi:MAG: DUF1800 domain-containing protein [Nocardioidaceae bacterium]
MTIDLSLPKITTSRRALLGAASVGAAGVLIPALAQPAAATMTKASHLAYKPAVYPQTLAPSEATRHLLSRFSSGVTPDLVATAKSAGGAHAWFGKQLTPNAIDDSYADSLYGWFPHLDLSAKQLWSLSQSGTVLGWQFMQNVVAWTMLRRLYSNRQVLESMVDFWANLLHIPFFAGPSYLFRVDYVNMLRQKAFGRYDDLLYSAVTHPAMGVYLDNAVSSAGNLNENLGREVLECHSVGLPYTEDDVYNSSLILTGWHVDEKTWDVSYVISDHASGPVQVMGFQDANKNPDGRALTGRYLKYLAHHPHTAQKICTRLAVRFVSDTPSQALIDQLANVYLASNTAILPVLRTLVNSAEFKASVDLKVRTPVEDAIASWAVLQVGVSRPTKDTDGANQFENVSMGIGQTVFDWARPDGFPDTADAWTGAARMLGSFRAHWMASGSFWPFTGITFQPVSHWVPQMPIRFDLLVDYLSQTLLARPSTSTLLQAACLATDCTAITQITPTHPLIKFGLPRLLVCLLDSPAHLTR